MVHTSQSGAHPLTRVARTRQIDFERAIKAAAKCGLRVVGIKPDGTVLTAGRDLPTAPEANTNDPDAIYAKWRESRGKV